jgi:membrane protein implicated in regulation of membrane protease activity
MNDNRLKTILVIVGAILILAVIAYAIYGFSLFWATFAAGITIGLLIIIIIVFIALTIYLWIRTLLLKRDLNRTMSELKQTKMELSQCRAKLNQKKFESE